MLVTPKFDGDNDQALQWAQHDVYGRALNVILHEAKQRLTEAEALLGTSSELGAAVSLGRFDHHVLQDAHDLLAAQWRASGELVHPRLPGTAQLDADLIGLWLDWLRDWVQRCEPAVAHAILQVAYAEPPPGNPYEVALLSRLERDLETVVQRRPPLP
jgi:hypothetical protein